MKRGSVYWTNLSDTTPPEFGKVRPTLLVSNSIQNELLETVVAVPLSSLPGEIWPLRLKLELAGQKTSFALVPGIRQIKKSRLLGFMGQSSAEFLQELDRAMMTYLTD